MLELIVPGVIGLAIGSGLKELFFNEGAGWGAALGISLIFWVIVTLGLAAYVEVTQGVPAHQVGWVGAASGIATIAVFAGLKKW
jgi:hypothetical protein